MQNQFNPRGRRPQYGKPKGQQSRKPVDIHPSRFVNKAVEPANETVYAPTHQFGDFGLIPQTVATLKYLNLTTPTEIQDKCIPASLRGEDVIGLANTGTGKTAAFLLPIIDKLVAKRGIVSVLILAPTRELAQQINEEFKRFSAGQKLGSTLLVGGANINRQIAEVQRGPHVVIGTPGRIKDLIGRRVLRLSNVSTFVLDEADRMCDMGFIRDIRMIENELPKQRQTFCYSATMTPAVKQIVEAFMKNPLTVSVVQGQTNDHIEQDIIHVRDKAHKIEVLTEMLSQSEFDKVIVFGATKFGMQRLSEVLVKHGIPAAAIHGNKSQNQRERALKQFKDGTVRVLVATDVAARGLDIPDVSHVINFDPPKTYDDYVHRIGRTGRAGKSGQALTFVQAAN